MPGRGTGVGRQAFGPALGEAGRVGQDRVYPSAVDWWIGATLLLCAALVPVLAVAAFVLARSDPADAATAGIGAVILAVVLAALTWPVRYTFAEDRLIVAFGWCRYRIPYAQITAAAPTRSPWSSPALSMDRVRISYGTKWVLISPRNRAGFLAELQRRAPRLRPAEDGGLSAE